MTDQDLEMIDSGVLEYYELYRHYLPLSANPCR
jgi:hypothetical protein